MPFSGAFFRSSIHWMVDILHFFRTDGTNDASGHSIASGIRCVVWGFFYFFNFWGKSVDSRLFGVCVARATNKWQMTRLTCRSIDIDFCFVARLALLVASWSHRNTAWEHLSVFLITDIGTGAVFVVQYLFWWINLLYLCRATADACFSMNVYIYWQRRIWRGGITANSGNSSSKQN